MSRLTVTVLQLGLLALLWLFVIAVVGVLRRDLFGARTAPRAAGGRAPSEVAGAVAGRPRSTAPAPAPSSAAAVPTAASAPAPAPPAPAAPRRLRALVVTEGPLAGTSMPLDGAPVTIGRAAECTLVLPDDYASSRHARLSPRDGRWVLEDLGSTNGTTLDRTPVSGPVEVPAGAQVRIGRTTFELRG